MKGDESMRAQFRRGRAAAICIIALLLFAFCAAAADTPDPAPHQVLLFEHTNYEGESMGFSYDNDIADLTQWNLISGGKWNDRISSVSIGKDTRVTFYEHVHYGGASISFEGNGENSYHIPDLHSLGWGDTVSSLKVRRTAVPAPDQVILFEHVNYDGAALYLTVGQDIADLRQNMISSGKSWNDRISSAKIGKNAQVLLCTDIGYGGPSIPYAADGQWINNIPTLHPQGWGDRVSSLKVREYNYDWTQESEPPTEPEAPEEPKEGDPMEGVEPPTPYQPPNIGDPLFYQVFLFEKADYGGQSLSFTYENDIPDLTRWNLPTGEKWNDRISSLKVGRGARIMLYEHVNYGGASIYFEGDGTNNYDVFDLHRYGWGDKVSSFKVRRVANPADNQVFLFEHENYDGAALYLHVGQDIPDLRQIMITSGKNWNDKISSLKTGKDALVHVWRDINFAGPSNPYSGDGQGFVAINSLHSEGWGDKISSLKVRAPGWTPESELPGQPEEPEGEQSDSWKDIEPKPYQVFFYEDVGFEGAAIGYEYDSDVKDLTKLLVLDSSNNWNDRISSIKIGKNAKVVLYEHTGCNDRSAYIVLQGDGQSVVKYDSLHSIGWGDRVSSFKVRMSDSLR